MTIIASIAKQNRLLKNDGRGLDPQRPRMDLCSESERAFPADQVSVVLRGMGWIAGPRTAGADVSIWLIEKLLSIVIGRYD